MTQTEFWELYNNGTLNAKLYDFSQGEDVTEVVAFEYEGKYFLRVFSRHPYLLHRCVGRKYSRDVTYHMPGEHCCIKEFETKDHANAYFKAVKKKAYEYIQERQSKNN